MPGLVPGTHILSATKQGVGGGDTPGTKCPGAAMTTGYHDIYCSAVSTSLTQYEVPTGITSSLKS
jgi:hypothetical protein